MIARLIRDQSQLLLLHTDGTISIVDRILLKNFLQRFKHIDSFTGNTRRRWDRRITPGTLDEKEIRKKAMESYNGTTIAYVSDYKSLVVTDPCVFREFMDFDSPDEYETTLEYAKKHGVSTSRVKLLCKTGRIPGAMQKGPRGQWFIPKTAKYPQDRRVNWD